MDTNTPSIHLDYFSYKNEYTIAIKVSLSWNFIQDL